MPPESNVHDPGSGNIAPSSAAAVVGADVEAAFAAAGKRDGSSVTSRMKIREEDRRVIEHRGIMPATLTHPVATHQATIHRREVEESSPHEPPPRRRCESPPLPRTGR